MLNNMLGLSMCIALQRITINVYGVQHDIIMSLRVEGNSQSNLKQSVSAV